MFKIDTMKGHERMSTQDLLLAIGEAVIGGPNFSLTNIGLGIIAGILLNLILPEPKETDPGLIAHTVEESEIVEERK